MNAELSRLKRDFEAEAREYHDLSLSVHFVVHGAPVVDTKFRHPNHTITLWQFIGNITSEEDVEEFASAELTRFGLNKATVSALGVIEGDETNRFVRMAKRAGSLLPKTIVQNLGVIVMDNFVDPEWPGKPYFALNSNPLAAWLNLVISVTATFQPGRFRDQTLAVDPFAASLAVFDHVFDRRNSSAMIPTSTSPLSTKPFNIALSFPGEQRDYVSKVAEILEDRIGGVFYDEYYQAELARPNLDTLLQAIYHNNSKLIVLFLCEDYARKEWCGLEWRAIRDLIMKRHDNIMPMRFDGAEIPGLFSIDGYIDLRKRTPDEAAELIIQRFNSCP